MNTEKEVRNFISDLFVDMATKERDDVCNVVSNAYKKVFYDSLTYKGDTDSFRENLRRGIHKADFLAFDFINIFEENATSDEEIEEVDKARSLSKLFFSLLYVLCNTYE